MTTPGSGGRSIADIFARLRLDGSDIASDVDKLVGSSSKVGRDAGEKVGKVSHLRNKEHLFLVGDETAVKNALAPYAGQSEQLALAIG